MGLLVALPALAKDDPGAGGFVIAPEAVEDYRTARAAALGLTVLGFVLGVAGAAASADHPEQHLNYRRLATLCGLAFTLIALDRMVVQGLAGWFLVNPADLPPWWR